jgi:ABC-type multidrug transport system fused ATPase/permease subunit
VFALMDLPGEAEDAGGAPVARLERALALERVAVALPNGARLLEDVTLTLRPGRITALVGVAGAGKTTLAYLLPRFVEPAAGRITWDGVELARLDLAALRRQIAFVFQETQLFDASVAENLRLGKPDASDAELWNALAQAGAAEFVRALPGELDAPLGRSGATLSVGQRQRLSIARALVRDASLLILDEPTSALDPETEQRLVASLREAARTRAVLVIAHRLSTIRDADEVWRVGGGRVVREIAGAR